MPDYTDKRLTPPKGGKGRLMQVDAPASPVHDAPDRQAEYVSEILHGERVRVFAEQNGFAQIQMERDRYVGWVPADILAEPSGAATYKVSAMRTHAYSAPDLKSVPVCSLPHGARLAVSGREGRFVKTGETGWVPEQHVVDAGRLEDDPAAVAERFLHSPYLWGGCSHSGVDCTGLTQAAFRACGVILPRDSDMQYAWAGEDISGWQEPGSLQRSDLVFWKGHVGIMLDAEMFLHANAHHMAVAIEPLNSAIERIAKMYGEPIGARRISVSLERGRRPDWLAAQD